MSDGYADWLKNRNIKPVEVTNKDKFYRDLLNIDNSWSGRMDVWDLGNTFIMEAEQLLINAMVLFEMGYFDCAYYSLRSAVEISTTIVFLSDMPDDERSSSAEAWRKSEYFPMYGQMLKELSEKGNIFTDMKEKMPAFFSRTRALSNELNKYVHKQGLRHLYVSRNHPINSNKSQDKFIGNFESHLKKCIGVVAVMRLAIDPFPVLLMDDEFLYRCFDTLTEPYSDEFVDEYIGQTILADYKKTDIYQSTYNAIITEERKTPAVFDVVKHQWIDSNKMDEILKQLSIMNQHDAISVLIVHACDKAVKIYGCGGLQMYFTNRETNRKTMSWGGVEFKNFAESEAKINQSYDEAYISVFIFEDEPYYVEHNELLSPDDVENVFNVVNISLSQLNT